MDTTRNSPSLSQMNVTWGASERHQTATDPLLKIDRAAALLGLSPATLTKWRTTRPGYGPRAFKMDSIVRFRVSDIEDWMNREGDDRIDLTVTPQSPQVMNLQQASAYLSLSSSSIHTWRTRRPEYGPPGFKAGGVLRFVLADLNRWVEERLETDEGDN